MDAITVAFVSGKGGTGKSTTSVYVGSALAAMGKKVLLLELDYGLRSIDIIAGISGQAVYDMEDVLTGRCQPYKALVDSPMHPGLTVIPAPYAAGSVTVSGLQRLVNTMRPYFDFILIDTAAGLGAPYLAATAAANLIVLVLTPDPIALRDGRKIADDLSGKNVQCRLILDRVDAKTVLKAGILRDLDEAIDLVGVQLLGVVPESPAIALAGVTGSPLPRQSKEQEVYNAIASRIMGGDVPLVYR